MTISERKIQRKDYFRAQMQFKSRIDKITFAVEYNFIAENYPEIAERIRDYSATSTIKELKKHFRTILKSNPNAKRDFDKWIKQSVPTAEAQLLKEIDEIVLHDRL